MPERVVLVGYGPVGARLIDGLLPAVRDGRIDLTVVGAEPHDVYNRVLLAEYAVGRTDRAGLDMDDRRVAEQAGVRFHLATTVVGVDRHRRVVRLHDGIPLDYDRLVLATGARANVPTLAGMERARRDRASVSTAPDNLDLAARRCPAASSPCATSPTRRTCARPSRPGSESSCWARECSGWSSRWPPPRPEPKWWWHTTPPPR